MLSTCFAFRFVSRENIYNIFFLNKEEAIKKLSIIAIVVLVVILSGAALAQTPDTAYFWNGGYFDEEYQWHDTVYTGINQWFYVPIYFMGGPDVTLEYVDYPLAARYDLIDEFSVSGCSLYYPLTEFCAYMFCCHNDDDTEPPFYSNPPGYHSLSFLSNDRGLSYLDPPLHSEVPLHIMSFKVHSVNNTTLPGHIFSDAFAPGIDPVYGPANSGDTLGLFYYPLFISNACLRIYQSYSYIPGDVNMSVGAWPPAALSADVTYLVNYFRGMPTSLTCNLNGNLGLFWASADVNGDCNIISSDVTKLISALRGVSQVNFCPNYPPLWLTQADLPAEAPPGWPGCE